MRDALPDVELRLTLEELSRALAVPPDWVRERMHAGLVEISSAGPTHWRLDAVLLRRVRSMRHTERCYGAAPELAALVADLEEQIALLRAQLARRS